MKETTTKRNTDFYNNLPGMICAGLEDFWVKNLEKKDWFLKAWEEYRQHVLSSNMDDIKMPYSIFKKYLSKEEIEELKKINN